MPPAAPEVVAAPRPAPPVVRRAPAARATGDTPAPETSPGSNVNPFVEAVQQDIKEDRAAHKPKPSQ
jgi:hypothetical protein